MIAFLRIIALCIAAAILFGLVHDQATARISIEYFTIGHPRLFASDSPTLHALAWGVIATWWVGLILGVLLAIASRAGGRPPLTWRDLARDVAVLLAVMLVLAAIVGVGAHLVITRLARQPFYLAGPMFDRFPRERHGLFAVAWAMHASSYTTGFVGGLVLAIRAWRRRGVLARDTA